MTGATDEEHPLQETADQMATPEDRRREVVASEGQALAFLWDRMGEILGELRSINDRLGSHSSMLKAGQARMGHMDRDIEKAQKLGKGLIASVLASAIALIIAQYLQGGGP